MLITMQDVFARFARAASNVLGTAWAFLAAALVIVAWAVSGPFLGFSSAWQLVINTGTTIVTFLMVFLIQNTQNLDSDAMQVKLDELIRAVDGAHNVLLDLEQLEEDELDSIREKYQRLAARARDDLRQGNLDTGSPTTDLT